MRSRALGVAFIAVALILAGIWGSHRGPVLRPVFERPPGHCVLPAQVMLRTHMMLLRYVRGEIVRHDARDRRFRLTRCINCHDARAVSGKAIPINQPGQFCASCHTYVGVHIDCFSCHAAIPTKFFGSHLSAQNAEGAQAAFRVPRVLLHGAGALFTGGR